MKVTELRSPVCEAQTNGQNCMQGHLKGVSYSGHFKGHAKGTGCCCQNYLRQGASPDRRSRVGRSSLKLKYFCCYNSCQLKSDRDSWLLSQSNWEKRGPAELCPPPRSTRSSKAHSLLWYPHPNEVPSTNLAIAPLQPDIPSGQYFFPPPFCISCI